MSRKLYVRTYGCQMNVYDSARMTDILAPLGFIMAEHPEDADVIILNTCHVREKASEKIFSELGRLRPLKEARQAAGGAVILVVAGCVAQAEGDTILERAPYVDIVLGPQTYHRLPEMVIRATQRVGQVLEIDFLQESKFDHLPPPSAKGVTTFLSVQEGCDKFCTFCVVPYTRGAEYSRPAATVLADASRLVVTGAKEVTLLGQNVNAYHGAAPDGIGTWGLERLLRALAGIDGLHRLRFVTSHPRDVDDELLEAFRDLPQLMPHLHLPVQSGSDRVLTAMNRGYTAADYRRLVDRLRRVRPTLALSGDFIVGFPGETEADFAATLDLVQGIGYAQAYSFKFSPRPGTPAADASGQIPDLVKTERLTRLQALLSNQQSLFNTAFIGHEVSVLLDRRGTLAGQLAGRSPYMQVVTVTAPDDFLGRIVDLHISHVRANSLDGTLVDLADLEHSTRGCGGACQGRGALERGKGVKM